MPHDLSPRMKLVIRLDQMRKKIHSAASLYLVSVIPYTVLIHPVHLQTPLEEKEISLLIFQEITQIFTYIELIFDVVSDDDLYDLNSYSDGIDGVIQRKHNYPKPQFFVLLVATFILRVNLSSEVKLAYNTDLQFLVTRPCPAASTTKKKALLYTLVGQIVYLLRTIAWKEGTYWPDLSAAQDIALAN